MNPQIETMLAHNIEKMMENPYKVDETDSYICQDNEDLKYLESRCDQLKMSEHERMILDDYIACLKTRDERYADLAYAAGVRDAVEMLQKMGILQVKKGEFCPKM